MFDLQNLFSSSNNTIHLTGKLFYLKKCFWLALMLRRNLLFWNILLNRNKNPPILASHSILCRESINIVMIRGVLFSYILDFLIYREISSLTFNLRQG